MIVERLFIDNKQIPIENTLNPSLTKSIKDIQDISKTKADRTKTIKIPRSKEADAVFDHVWDFNISNPTFNPAVKIDCRYDVGGITLLNGYCQLTGITVINKEQFQYNIIIYGTTANFITKLKDIYMDEIDLSIWDHPFNADIQSFSWDTFVFFDGGLIPFEFGNGYVYIPIDYGMSSDLLNWYYKDMPCCFYVKTIVDAMFVDAGFTYTSAFFESDFWKRLIIPFSPEQYALTSDEIAERTFVANTPEFTSTGTDTSGNISKSGASALDTIIFTNEVSDAGGNYDETTGIYTALKAGAMKFTAVVDLQAIFTPDDLIQSLTQTSELFGFIRMVYTPTSTGIPVVVDSLQVVITVDQTGGIFTIGVRSSSEPASFPDSDYEQSPTWSTVGASANPVSRGVNPPNRYRLTWTNGNILPLDEVKVQFTGIYRESLSGTQTFFETAGGADIDGECQLKLVAGAFSNQMINNEMTETNILLISKLLPKNIKQSDFFTSLVKMFNLFVEPDPLNPLNLNIEPRDDYLGTTTKNIHEKIDRDSIEIKPIALQNFKELLYTYKKDSDYYNKKYEDRYGEVYGERRIESTNEFNQNTSKTEVIFSPTPSAAPPDSDFIIPTIVEITEDGTAKSLKHNIRILHYSGLRPTENVWTLQGDIVFSAPVSFTTYPFAGMWDDPFLPTLSLCFGNEREVFYDKSIDPIVQTNANLVNVYSLKQLLQITDTQSQLVEAMMDASYKDYDEFTFDLLYFFDESYWRLQSIDAFNPTVTKNTKGIFLKFIDTGDFTPDNVTLDDADDPVLPDLDPFGGEPTIDPSEKSAFLGGKAPLQPDGNAYYGKTVEVTGKDNYVNSTAKWIYIEGDGNNVFAGAENISLKNSNNNTIEAGVTNVTLLGTDGLYITESNVTFVNGVKATDHHSGKVEIAETETLDVLTEKQMTVWGTLDNDGIVNVDGELIIEP